MAEAGGAAASAGALYVVRFWVAPEAEAELIGWLDGGHLQEVVDQPGFVFGQRLTLEERDDNGWQGYMNIYGVRSMEALQTYFGSAIQERFREEASRFSGSMRIERSWGTVAQNVVHGTADA